MAPHDLDDGQEDKRAVRPLTELEKQSLRQEMKEAALYLQKALKEETGLDLKIS